MDINKALWLARRARFSRTDDYRKESYTASLGGFSLALEHIPRDLTIGGGYGLEHDDQYILIVSKNGTRLCADIFTRRELVGVGSPLRTEEEGDVRILSLYTTVSRVLKTHS